MRNMRPVYSIKKSHLKKPKDKVSKPENNIQLKINPQMIKRYITNEPLKKQ